ncbi:hypothetical protein [Texcoconibacillus texcoconensis]|uniref:G5 domain-containing protein n=1 Tax=Texcoconibacillus texcoconensis TaxID=1095777 RepID=A0A840QSS3_9BACI|nr:hypothetical protein [Texcoconibacillus texcoconensis]MBB5174400.1 hypothetical protein [Texcoconibacillus texcoconensis]
MTETKKYFFLAFSLITAAGMALFLFFTSTTAAYERWVVGEPTFSQGEQIAGIDIGGMTVEEAAEMLEEWAEISHPSPLVEVAFFDEDQHLSHSAVTIDVPQTVEEVMEGTRETWSVDIDRQEVEAVLNTIDYEALSKVNLTDVVIDEVKERLTFDVNDTVVVDLNELLPDELKRETTVVASVERRITDASTVGPWLESLDGTKVEGHSIFSLLNALEEAGIHAWEGDALNTVGSIVYELLLQTNMQVVDRETNETLPETLPLGFDVYLNPSRQGLIIDNINVNDYELTFTQQGERINAELIGPDFPHEFRVRISEEQMIDPRTIVRRNDSLHRTSQIVRHGEQGAFAVVERRRINEQKERIETETISEDFYSPVHHIEERSQGAFDDDVDEEEALEEETGSSDEEKEEKSDENDEADDEADEDDEEEPLPIKGYD